MWRIIIIIIIIILLLLIIIIIIIIIIRKENVLICWTVNNYTRPYSMNQQNMTTDRNFCISYENTAWMVTAEVISEKCVKKYLPEMHETIRMNGQDFAVKVEFFKSWKGRKAEK